MNKKKILIADDEANIRLLLQDELCEEGYEVLTAENGAQAVGIVEDNPPDLIILDVKMPEMSGIDAIHWIKDISKGTPIIICSAFAGIEELFSEVKDNISAFFAKPVNLLLLKRKIGEILAKK